MKTQIKCLDKFKPIITKRKRTKIIVGGRGSTKSTFVADYVLACMSKGQLWCCGREFQNSIDESVHRLLADEIDRLDIPGFEIKAREIVHSSGGRDFYVGLSRNILSLKGILSGVDGLWIEEGEGLSDDTLRVLTGSVRLTARDYDAAQKLGLSIDQIKKPEIIITMNRGSKADPISQKYLKRAESALEARGYYEDDSLMIIQANYTDMPKSWFLASGLEEERADDEKYMTEEQYKHKWLGGYLETIENPLIQYKWFQACIDAHEKLGFKPDGAEIVSHDPSDLGPDAAATIHRHGSVIKNAFIQKVGDINEKFEEAIQYALDHHVDLFVFDGDGMGAPLRKRADEAFNGKSIAWEMYKGSEGVEDPKQPYIPPTGSREKEKPRTNGDVFFNRRSQQYCRLADRMYKTWEAVVKGKYHNPNELISFSSEIECLDELGSELSRIPISKRGNNGKIKILSKNEMKTLGIQSPNLADGTKMSLIDPPVARKSKPIKYVTWQ